MLSFLPEMLFDKLTDIRPRDLRARKLLLLDFDNTMLPYTTDVPTQALLDWLAEMQAAGITPCVVSNSRKPRVPRFCQTHQLACVTHAGKPGTRGIREALRRFDAGPADAALVGDQIFTDVLGANLAGVAAIHVRSIHNHTVWLKLRHVFEVPFLKLAERRRIS